MFSSSQPQMRLTSGSARIARMACACMGQWTLLQCSAVMAYGLNWDAGLRFLPDWHGTLVLAVTLMTLHPLVGSLKLPAGCVLSRTWRHSWTATRLGGIYGLWDERIQSQRGGDLG